jgi:GT2 family glycosyltransferase
MHSISVIVATKDRPADLRRLLDSLGRQTARPAEIVVVDASIQPVESVLAEFSELHLRYLRHWPPSAAAQRNAGVLACSPSATLIGFLDDDTTFESDAFANMMRFWDGASPEVLGAAFNIRNYPARGAQSLKHSRLAEYVGLYSAVPGSVSPSGWQTIMTEVAQTRFVDWLPSTAVIWRREIFGEQLFDEFFQSYSYLEDLDFSHAVGRRGRLAVVADAGFSHFPSPGGRVSQRQFGQIEVHNRLYFVRKHGLSIPRCYIGIGIRLAMTLFAALARLDRGMLGRACGNLQALFEKP